VTGEGDVVSCSEKRHRDLFHAALAGQGQCAIVTRAKIRLEASPASVRRFSLRYADVTTALDDATRLVEEQRFDGVVIVVVPTAGGERLYFLNATPARSAGTIPTTSLPPVRICSASPNQKRGARGPVNA
jgi:cytokinin dehydrogenase